MAKQTDLARKIAQIDADIDRLIEIRAYLEKDDSPQVREPKPRRVRKPKAAPEQTV